MPTLRGQFFAIAELLYVGRQSLSESESEEFVWVLLDWPPGSGILLLVDLKAKTIY